MRLAIRLRVAHLLGGPTRDQKAVRTIYIYTDSEIIVLTRWGSLRLAPIIYIYTREGVFYIGGRGFVCQIIEPVTFARCAFIFALCNIALGGYLYTRRNI